MFSIAFLWGFSEATFFFFIPDIYLTWIAISNPRAALKACFITAIAACIGGSLMYLWGTLDSQYAYRFLAFVPAIEPKLIAQVLVSIQGDPFYALFVAPLKGIPYKIYAVAMGAQEISFFKFIVTSFFARLFRFLLITGFSIIVFSRLKNFLDRKSIACVHIITWAIIYSLYFSLMGQR